MMIFLSANIEIFSIIVIEDHSGYSYCPAEAYGHQVTKTAERQIGKENAGKLGQDRGTGGREAQGRRQ